MQPRPDADEPTGERRDRTLLTTFDVFDTLLVRSVARPRDVFLVVGRRLREQGLVDVSPTAFADLRATAEQLVWGRRGRDGGVSLADVYEEVALSLGGDGGTDQLVATELDVERLVLHPSEVGRRVLHAAAARGRVAIASDMYLSESFLAEVLSSHDLLPDGARIYVSGTRRASKETGSLFGLVAATEAVAPGAIAHVGNDRRTDVASAARAGVEPRPLLLGNLNRFERTIADVGSSSGGLASALAGSARVARTRGPDDAITRIACSVAGPILTAYVTWVLVNADRQGLDRLYFLSRDGQVLHRIAEALAPALAPDTALHYLHTSRRAVNLPALGRSPQRFRDWIWTHVEGASARELATLVGLDPTVLDDLRPIPPLDDPRRPLTGIERDAVVSELIDTGHVAQEAERRWPALRAYWSQAGVLDDVDIGVVDLGGHGSQFEALALARLEALGRPGAARTWGAFAYLATRPPSLEDELDAVRRSAWLYDSERGVGLPGFRGLVTMLEMFCVADHGTLLAVDLVDGEPVARLAEADPRLDDWGARSLRRSVVAVAEVAATVLPLVDHRADVRPAVVAALKAFWSAPDDDEAAVWGAFPFDDRAGPRRSISGLAAPLSVAEAVNWRLRSRWPLPWYAWPAASVGRSGPVVRSLVSVLDEAARLRRLLSGR